LTGEPSSVRSVRFPAAYGTPGGADSLLPWSYVVRWIAGDAVGAPPDGQPLDLRPSLASEAEAIILEGTAEYVTDASDPLVALFTAASKEKYPQWTLEGFPRGATRWRFDNT